MPATGSASTDDIVMRLILKGQEPAEAARMARMPVEAMRAEYAAGVQKIQAAFTGLYEATTKEAQKAAKAEVKLQQDKTRQVVAALKEIEREHAKATKTMSSNWRRTLEDLENATIVAQGLVGGFQTIASSAKHLGEEIIRTTNIFQSLTGSIDDARAATDGTVSDMELITAKNAAMSAGLQMSDRQFADLAKAADAYGDAVGISAKEAMDPLIASIAAGNDRMLKRIGIVIDAERVEKRYAAVIEKTRDELTEEEKRAAFAAEALDKIRKKNEQLNDSPPTFATVIERAFVGSKNAWDRMVASIGSFQIPGPLNAFLDKAGAFMAAYENTSAAYGFLPGGNAVRAAQAAFNMGTGIEGVNAQIDAIGKGYGGKFARTLTPEGEVDEPAFLTRKRFNKPKFDKSNVVYQSPDTVTGLDRLFLQAALKEQETLTKIQADAWEHAAEEGRKRMAEYLEKLGTGKDGDLIPFAGTMATADYRKDFATAQGKAAQSLRYQQASGVSLKDAKGSANLDEDFVRGLQEAVDASREKAGGGLLGQLLFGDDTTLDQTYARMDEFKQRTIDTIGEMNDFFKEAAKASTDALGHSIGAYLAEGNASGVSAKKVVHELTKGLAQQAAAKAAWEGVEALASLIGGDFPGAAQHGAKAALYGTFAATMGATSRATFTAPSTGSTPTSVRGSSAGTGGGSRSSGGGGDSPTIVFNINGMIGDSESIIREVGRGIDEYRRKNARLPWSEKN
jgi:hypothetical protein